jgi:hypothetical protein
MHPKFACFGSSHRRDNDPRKRLIELCLILRAGVSCGYEPPLKLLRHCSFDLYVNQSISANYAERELVVFFFFPTS